MIGRLCAEEDAGTELAEKLRETLCENQVRQMDSEDCSVFSSMGSF